MRFSFSSFHFLQCRRQEVVIMIPKSLISMPVQLGRLEVLKVWYCHGNATAAALCWVLGFRWCYIILYCVEFLSATFSRQLDWLSSACCNAPRTLLFFIWFHSICFSFLWFCFYFAFALYFRCTLINCIIGVQNQKAYSHTRKQPQIQVCFFLLKHKSRPWINPWPLCLISTFRELSFPLRSGLGYDVVAFCATSKHNVQPGNEDSYSSFKMLSRLVLFYDQFPSFLITIANLRSCLPFPMMPGPVLLS